jgi:nicotinate-nucleotide adenylyltransferase
MLWESPHPRKDGPRYGVIGGTFDPPHYAHLFIAQESVARLALERVYFIPTAQPPHKLGRQISPAADRLAMVERAIAGNPSFAVSTVELERPGPSYTVDTLAALRTQWGASSELAYIVGWDMLLDLPHWHCPSDVVKLADWIVAVYRPGYAADGAATEVLYEVLPELRTKLVTLAVPQLGISATELRTRVASSLPIRYLVPDSVEEYVAKRGLYRADSARAATARPLASSVYGTGTVPAGPGVVRDGLAVDQEVRP